MDFSILYNSNNITDLFSVESNTGEEMFIWENYDEFIDDSGTRFIKLHNGPHDYIFFVDGDDEGDYCDRQQLIDWDIKVIDVIR